MDDEDFEYGTAGHDSHWAVVREYHGTKDTMSVLIASNERGRIEPFVFHSAKDAEAAADALRNKPGHIEVVLVYHGVEALTEESAGLFITGLGGLRVVE